MSHNTTEDKIFMARVEDMFTLCDKYNVPRFSGFLDGAKQVDITNTFFNRVGYNTILFGGYEDSERKIFAVLPDWYQADEVKYPISCIAIAHSFGTPLSHRDYLGSVMGLGFERSKVGDIIVDDNTAYMFVIDDIAEYILQNLNKIGSRGVKVTNCKMDDITIPEKKVEVLDVVAASPRLDAVLASIMNTSRSIAAEYVKSGRVEVDHKLVIETDYRIDVGTLLSVRGFGRIQLEEIGSMTRKGRQHMTFKKYI